MSRDDAAVAALVLGFVECGIGAGQQVSAGLFRIERRNTDRNRQHAARLTLPARELRALDDRPQLVAHLRAAEAGKASLGAVLSDIRVALAIE